MKILFFINSLAGGGAERVTVNLANEFVREGHSVGLFLKEKVIAYKLDERVNIYCPIHNAGHRPSKLKSAMNYMRRLKATKNTIENLQPDIIVASWGCNLFQILVSHGQVPIVASEHNTFERHHSLHEKFNRFFLNKFVNRVVVLTRYDKAYVARQLKNTVVIPNPLTYTPMSEEEYDDTFSSRNHILACGRLNAWQVKGFDLLMRSFALIASRFKDWKLDIAGTGDDKSIAYIRQLIEANGLQDRVKLLGFCNDMAELMKQHAIFVLSSRSEGFGMVITEAMANGCPCVSFDLSGPSEIIIDTIDGLLVEPQNCEALSKSIALLISNVELRRIMGKRAIHDVNRFCENVIAERWITLFNSL